jgi:hypothetical protein
MVTPVMELTNKVREIATKKEMTFRSFAGQCLLRGLSYDTAKELWNKAEKARGFNPITKQVAAEILGRPVKDVFGD